MCKGPVVGGSLAGVLDEMLDGVQRDSERQVHEEMERHIGPKYTGSSGPC